MYIGLKWRFGYERWITTKIKIGWYNAVCRLEVARESQVELSALYFFQLVWVARDSLRLQQRRHHNAADAAKNVAYENSVKINLN